MLVKCPGRKADTFRIVSQADIVRFCVEHISEDRVLHALCTSPISDSHPVRDPASMKLVHIDIESHMITALKLLVRHTLSALPVTDSNQDGKLIATLSSSIFREILEYTNFVYLINRMRTMSVRSFLKVFGPDQLEPPFLRQITCLESDNMLEVMMKALKHNVHRVWCVDLAGRPLRAITYSDFIEMIEKDFFARK